MPEQPTRERVIFALVRKDGQQNKELIKSADTNNNSLAIVLKQLQKEKIIVKKEDRYYFSTELENTTLKALGSAYSITHSLDGFGEMLSVSTDPFPKGIEKISEIIRLQIVLRVERFAVPKLTKRDKLEFDIYFDVLDASLQWIFEILRKKDPNKTDHVRIGLIRTMDGKKK
ncbi:MAG: hypothetical protein HOD60_12125 [Candidatus Nitrosopelagicus sp.]|jgi:predicted transcriptional regulator|nr:hypothetical protein [Candidatus Nitrosopelagicus sp.]